MSTILDALRKLEEERKRRQGADPIREALEPVAAPAGSLPARSGQAVRVGAVVLVLVAAVLVTYRLATREGRSVENVPPSTPAVALRGPARDSSLSSVLSPPGSASADRAAHSVPPALSEAPRGQVAQEAAASPGRPRSSVVDLPDTRSSPARVAPFPEGTELGIEAEVPVAATEEAAPQDAEEEVPLVPEEIPLEEPDTEKVAPEPRRATAEEEQGIRISAVVWSPEPENRFAVVNLRTLREGEEISGRVVDEIQPDGVIFVEGGQRYKVLLGRR